MTRVTNDIFVRTDIWREGKWLDLWSVVHFLSGMSVAFGIFLLSFDPLPAVVIAFLLFTAYEMWEALVHIDETTQNRIMDVVVGMVSFLPTFFYLSPALGTDRFMPVVGTILVINIVLSIVGWHASQKAAALERAFRARLKEEKRKLRVGGQTLRKRGRGLRRKVMGDKS